MDAKCIQIKLRQIMSTKKNDLGVFNTFKYQQEILESLEAEILNFKMINKKLKK